MHETIAGRPAFTRLPDLRIAGRPLPWVWYAPTLPGLPGPEEEWMFARFLSAGIAVAGIDVGESYGSPDGRALFTAFHDALTRRGFDPRPVLLGRSRGGLQTLSWAAENPEKVAAFAGIYPVCSVASWPGLAQAAGAYRMTEGELRARLSEHDPVARLAPLVRARVPLFAIHGDRDTVVPLEANSGEVRRRVVALGGSMELVVPPGQGHTMWPGFFQSQALVDFVLAHAQGIRLDSPVDFQVLQRTSRERGTIPIRGALADPAPGTVLEARLDDGPWRRVSARFDGAAFSGRIAAPAGGWFRLGVRARRGREIVGETQVPRVGIGEVFVVAGQSNAANHGEERQRPRRDTVAAFDGARWRPADDPQPGASGDGGSFLPPLGDAIVGRFQVPVGFVACAIGATSVREWLPAGVPFPNPPTLEGRVRRRDDGRWESDGAAFGTLVARMRALGPRGFRAVLWHQGESDANQADPTRTLSGALYRECLTTVIARSRHEIGWDAPWMVAQASYHVPGDEASPDIRAAQAALWKARGVLPGPDTDSLRGPWRDSGGKGVHFSGPGLREHAALWREKLVPWLERFV